MGRENIEANVRRSRILFVGFVARMEDTRLPKCAMFEELVGGAGCVGGQGKEKWMGCLLDDLRDSVSERLQAMTRENGVKWRNKRRSV